MKTLLLLSAFAILSTTAAQAQTAPADCVNVLGFCIPAHQEQDVEMRRGEEKDNLPLNMPLRRFKDLSDEGIGVIPDFIGGPIGPAAPSGPSVG